MTGSIPLRGELPAGSGSSVTDRLTCPAELLVYGLYYVLMNRWGWRKVVASYLLAWTFLCLCVPMSCAEDRVAIPGASSAIAQAFETQSDRGNAPVPSYEDDCFCCCAHIVPTPHFSVAAPTDFVAVEPALLYGEPRKLAISVYHPPRS